MFPYEKLEVYQKACELNRQVYSALKNNQSLPAYIKNQLGRASLSIVLNIAEGNAKFGNKDRRSFFKLSPMLTKFVIFFIAVLVCLRIGQ